MATAAAVNWAKEVPAKCLFAVVRLVYYDAGQKAFAWRKRHCTFLLAFRTASACLLTQAKLEAKLGLLQKL